MIVAINILMKRLQIVPCPWRHLKIGQEYELRPMRLQGSDDSIHLLRRSVRCWINDVNGSRISQSKRKRGLCQIEKRIAGMRPLSEPFIYIRMV